MAQTDPPLEPERQPRSANPFGYADHSPFSAFGVELVYGLRQDGALAHISGVDSGLACDCVCPACGRTLVAHKGTRNVHHFKHHGSASGCGHNAETNAHSWAKEVLARELRILIPEVGARSGQDSVIRSKARIFDFASAELEKVLDDIVPDVILTTRDGQRLLVEVMVTHACGPDKKAKLRERGLATVEVDLSRWRKSSDRLQIEEALVERAPREWLYNRKVDEAEQALRDAIAAREARAAEAARLRQERAAAERLASAQRLRRALEAKVTRVARAAAAARASRSDAGHEELAAVRRRGTLDLLLPRQQCCGFLVPNERWQAAILERVVEMPIGDGFFLPRFGIESAMRAIEDCVHEQFRRDLDADIRAALPDTLNQLSLPRQAVETYLHHLCLQGILQGDGFGGFELTDDRAEALEKAHVAWQSRERRRRAVDRAMEKILQAVPPEERAHFSPERWQQRIVPGFDRRLEALVLSDDAVWQRFDQALRAIERMIEGGETVSETLGLPLKGEIARANQRACEKAQKEGAEREATLRTAARDAVGADAPAWLTAAASDGVAPTERARRDTAGLQAALRALDDYRCDRAARIAAETLATSCRRQLKTEAEKELGPAVAQSFLNNYDAQLKARPWEMCTDAGSLKLARAALATWVARNKRSRRR